MDTRVCERMAACSICVAHALFLPLVGAPDQFSAPPYPFGLNLSPTLSPPTFFPSCSLLCPQLIMYGYLVCLDAVLYHFAVVPVRLMRLAARMIPSAR